jgi:hypothetical protein
MRTIFHLEAPTLITKVNQISGLHKPDYSQLLVEAKLLSLRALPLLFANYRDLCIPYVSELAPLFLKFSHE